MLVRDGPILIGLPRDPGSARAGVFQGATPADDGNDGSTRSFLKSASRMFDKVGDSTGALRKI